MVRIHIYIYETSMKIYIYDIHTYIHMYIIKYILDNFLYFTIIRTCFWLSVLLVGILYPILPIKNNNIELKFHITVRNFLIMKD